MQVLCTNLLAMPKYQMRVDVTPAYLPHQSSPDEGLYVLSLIHISEPTRRS